jgi:hypothetical protein
MNTSMFIVAEINVVGNLLCPLKVLGVLRRGLPIVRLESKVCPS